jgi:hypothetical protein
MANPFRPFVVEAQRLTDLMGSGVPVPAEQLADYSGDQRRLDFLRDLVARVAVLAYCYDSLCRLCDVLNAWEDRTHALPPEPGSPYTRVIPPEFTIEREQRLVEVDAHTALLYYEITSLVWMLRQLHIVVPEDSEVYYLVKIRDRFISHVQLSGVARRADHGYLLPQRGFLRRDVVSLNAWGPDDLRALGDHALEIGSAEWSQQRRRNEDLVLSSKRNKDWTPEERQGLLAAGVRECDLELAIQQLADILSKRALPIVQKHTQRMVDVYGWTRMSEWGLGARSEP